MGSWEQQPRQGHMSKPRHMRAQAPQRAAGVPDMPARRGIHVPKGPARTGSAPARSASGAHVAQHSRGASVQGAHAGARGAAGNVQPPAPSHWNSRAAYIELARKRRRSRLLKRVGLSVLAVILVCVFSVGG